MDDLKARWRETLRRLTGRAEDEEPRLTDDALAELIANVRSSRLTYCGRPKMENMAIAARRVIDERVPGDFIEAGVALGGSAIVLARLKERRRPLYLYDVFAMIPAPGPSDGEDAHNRYQEIASGKSKGLGTDVYYGYRDDLIDVVKTNLAAFGAPPEENGIHLVRGLFEDVMHFKRRIAFAHIDCDWYDSVKVCIDRILPRLSPGGVIAFDDYSSFSGCHRAVDELLAARPDIRVIYQERSIGLRLDA